MEEALASGVNDLDLVEDRLESQQKWLDVDTLVHIQKTAPRRETSPDLAVVISAASGALAVLLALGMFYTRNSSVLPHAAGAPTNAQKTVHPGPRHTPFRIQ